MIAAVPIVGRDSRRLDGARGWRHAAAQATDPRKTSGAADVVDFAQAVRTDLNRAAAILAQQSAHGAAKG